MRAPFQVLILPYRKLFNGIISYCIFRRSDFKIWQGIAGGGEENETPIESARRESNEEAEVNPNNNFIQLQTKTSVPVSHFAKAKYWQTDIYVIPEYSFGVEIGNDNIILSHEHTEHKWVSYEEAISLLFFESNKTALWELNTRLCKMTPCNSPPPAISE